MPHYLVRKGAAPVLATALTWPLCALPLSCQSRAGDRPGPGQTPSPVIRTDSGAPQWVSEVVENPERQASSVGEGGMLRAVGKAHGRGPNRTPFLARISAEREAREELGKVIGRRVDSLLSEWMLQAKGMARPDKIASRAFREMVARDVSTKLSARPVVKEHWKAPDGAVYALAAVPQDQAFFQAVCAGARRGFEEASRYGFDVLLGTDPGEAIAALSRYLARSHQPNPAAAEEPE